LLGLRSRTKAHCPRRSLTGAIVSFDIQDYFRGVCGIPPLEQKQSMAKVGDLGMQEQRSENVYRLPVPPIKEQK
jgi:hypothetical protein